MQVSEPLTVDAVDSEPATRLQVVSSGKLDGHTSGSTSSLRDTKESFLNSVAYGK